MVQVKDLMKKKVVTLKQTSNELESEYRRTLKRKSIKIIFDIYKIIFDIYEEFKLTTPAFIQKVSDGRTLNHNETIHSILFEVVPKAVRLGAALAVIIYNDGYNAVKCL